MIFLLIILILTAAAAILLIAACGVTVNDTLMRGHDFFTRNGKRKREPSEEQRRISAVRQAERAELESRPHETLEITSDDGIRLVGYYFPANGGGATDIAVLCHGYHSSGLSEYGGIAMGYLDNGIGVLVIDQRAHGESGGKWICFGVKERNDIKLWCEEAVFRYSPERIWLHGISMGAASALMASSLDLPGEVSGVIADCGFTSPWEIFRHITHDFMHIPDFPVLYICDMMARRRAGFSFREASAPESIGRSELPALFIHGGEDNFVPVSMSEESYKAAKGRDGRAAGLSGLHIIPGAAHAGSRFADPDGYTAMILEFIERIKKEND